MNKKGELVLRDFMIMILIGTVIFAFATIFITDMAETYNNVDLQSQFNKDIGLSKNASDIFSASSTTVEEQSNLTEQGMGPFKEESNLDAIIDTVKTIFTAPVSFGTLISSSLDNLQINSSLSTLVGKLVMSIIYILIVFVIVSAFLKGGKV